MLRPFRKGGGLVDAPGSCLAGTKREYASCVLSSATDPDVVGQPTAAYWFGELRQLDRARDRLSIWDDIRDDVIGVDEGKQIVPLWIWHGISRREIACEPRAYTQPAHVR